MELEKVNLKPLKEEMTQQGSNTKMELDMMSAQLQELNAALMKLGDRLNNKELENERLQNQLAESLKTQQNLTARNETGMNLMFAQLREKDAALMKLGDRLNDKELENERLQKQLAECLKTQQNLKARNETGMNIMSAQLREKDAALMKLGDRLNELELENERLKIQLTARYENEFVFLSLLLCSFFSLILV